MRRRKRKVEKKKNSAPPLLWLLLEDFYSGTWGKFCGPAPGGRDLNLYPANNRTLKDTYPPKQAVTG